MPTYKHFINNIIVLTLFPCPKTMKTMINLLYYCDLNLELVIKVKAQEGK
jgi:hypothetical protein